MSFELGWNRRDDEGQRIKIAFKLVRDKAAWTVQHSRFERWQPYAPEARDWEDLFEVLERHLARGKVSIEDAAIVRQAAIRQRHAR
jgi:hypothetical protein